MTHDQALDELSKIFRDQKGAVLVGAGASLGAGLPRWNNLLSELCDSLSKVPGIDSSLVESCRRMLPDQSKWLMLASILRRHLGTGFQSYIEDRFCDPSLSPTEIHKAIVTLPFKFLATINYDDLLEAAYSEHYVGKKRLDSLTYDKPGDVASYFYRGKEFVLYCHGRAKTDAEKVVLTDGDYRSLIQAQIGYQSIVQTLFTTTSFLFVGTSFGDPDIQLLLGFLHSAFHGKTPPHYAILPESHRETAEINQLFHDFKLNVITLNDADFGTNLLSFLNELKARI
jgi:hypothetical protein